MRTVWVDRSRIESYQRCPRLRWLEYHQSGRGIAPAKKPLPLCVGGSVHVGLEHLLSGESEDRAVLEALTDFQQHRSALALDTTELAEMTPVATFDSQLVAQAAELGLSADDPQYRELFERQRNLAAEFDSWLFSEQAALVEGLVRAYARRRLPALLAEFEIVEGEREGESWELSREPLYETDKGCGYLEPGEHYTGEDRVIRFMSRPDAVLRSRSDGNLYLLSYKTAATWDVRKARDAEHDMQGISEAIDVERRLGERVMGIRYEYMLKGYRGLDKDLSARFGLNVWSQRSHLIRKYVATSIPSRGVSAYAVGDVCWSHDYHKDDGSTSKLAWQNWRSRPVWEDGGTVREWIDMLDDSHETMSADDATVGMEPRALGIRSAAQALGYTSTHPLDEVFPAPMTVYRSDDQSRDWVEQVEAQERRIAESVAQVESAPDEGERRHRLNTDFPQSRRACSYPTECAFTRVCYGGDDIKADPLASGLYKIREVNHPQELSERLSDDIMACPTCGSPWGNCDPEPCRDGIVRMTKEKAAGLALRRAFEELEAGDTGKDSQS